MASSSMTTSEVSDTRLRLLEAAGPIFAQKGFGAATIKEISDAAGANIAAVNYHFGDKDRFYAEVLRYAHHCAVGAVDAVQPPPGDDPEAALRAFVAAMVGGIFDPHRPSWHARLIARELMQPTEALDELVELNVRPKADRLRAVIGRMTGLPPDHERVQRCVLSIVAQCVFLHHGRPVVSRLFPDLSYDPAKIADHIAAFSIAAVYGVRDASAKRRASTGRGRKR